MFCLFQNYLYMPSSCQKNSNPSLDREERKREKLRKGLMFKMSNVVFMILVKVMSGTSTILQDNCSWLIPKVDFCNGDSVWPLPLG